MSPSGSVGLKLIREPRKALSGSKSFKSQTFTSELGFFSRSMAYYDQVTDNSLIDVSYSPITVGTIAIIILFTYLRLSSNRCVAPVTLFDWLLNVALGSTLAGIVNGTSLTRGLISLATLMAFQFVRYARVEERCKLRSSALMPRPTSDRLSRTSSTLLLSS